MNDHDNHHNFTTIDDVAALANVSRITVSRVFNPKWKGRVKESTVEKVMQAARELNYTPNGIARSLISNKTNLIAVVVNARPGFFYSEVLARIVRALQQAGWQALVFCDDITDDVEEVVTRVLHQRVDAVVVTSSVLARSTVHYFRANPHIPVILFKRIPPASTFSSIWCDEPGGARLVAEYLWQSGHRNIALLHHPRGETGRGEAFMDQLNRHGLKPVMALETFYSHSAGYENTVRVLEAHPETDAVFCDEDDMAMGAMDAARRYFGLRVPEDISIVGFDDNLATRYPAYDLSTVSHPLDDMIDALIEAIRLQLEDPDVRTLKEFPMEFIKRSSSR